MRQNASGKLSGFGVAVLLSCTIATVLSIIFAKSTKLFILNENQLLYLFSAMAQVMGSVFGLTLTAYVFFVDKFKKSTEDDTLYDAVIALLNYYFQNLIILAAVCAVVIIICIIGIIDLHNGMKFYSFIINESVQIFVIGIITILIFGIMLLSPGKLDNELKRMKKRAEKDDPYSANKVLGDFAVFLKTYNMLEQLIKDFADMCMNRENALVSDPKSHKPQMIQALKELGHYEIINPRLSDEINRFRIYRNSLVHGVDFEVTNDVCNRILKIYHTLQNAYDVYEQSGNHSEEWGIAIRKVYDLTR